MDQQTWYIQAMEYESVLKREELSSQEKMGGTLSAYLQVTETNVRWPHTTIPTLRHSGKDKSMETGSKEIRDFQGPGEGAMNR